MYSAAPSAISYVFFQIPSRGPRPNTSFIGASLGADTLTPAGHVKIFPTFQLQNYPHIFAAGDIADWPEQKQTGKYYTHADIVSENVLSMLAGRKPTKAYKGSIEMIVLTIGKVCAITSCKCRIVANILMV
jgi:apoptosis-inducing factor 2